MTPDLHSLIVLRRRRGDRKAWVLRDSAWGQPLDQVAGAFNIHAAGEETFISSLLAIMVLFKMKLTGAPPPPGPPASPSSV